MALDPDHALAWLFAHKAATVGWIVAIVGDPGAAEDAFQELAVLLVRKAGLIVDEAALPAWVRTAARYEALKQLRRSGRHRHLPLSDDVLDACQPEWDAAFAEDGDELLEHLRACLARLAPEAQRLVRLRYERRLAGDDLARSAGKSPGAVHMAFHRIHLVLSECIRGRVAARRLGDAR